MPDIRAVIFDLDDTLYPERQYAYSGFAAVAAAFADRLGDPAAAAADMRRLFDTPDRPRVFNSLLEARGMGGDRSLVAAMVDTYRRHRPTIALYEDADDALTRLRGRYQVGVISDGPAYQQAQKVAALGLRDRVDEVILTDTLGAGMGKPNPRAFELMAERLSVPHAACVYVADNPAKDFVAPNALGWLTVQVCRADGIYRGAASPPGGAAGRTIVSLFELASCLYRSRNG